MSLQIWLPLNGNLDNYGVSNTTLVTNSGATVNSSGKIGSCYYFNNHYISYTCSAVNSFTECSIALWVKVPTTHSGYAQVCVLGTAGTSWNNILLGIDINSSGVPIGSVSTGSGYSSISFDTAIKDGNWHHLCLAYKSGSFKIYLDGVYRGTQSGTPNFAGITNIYVGGNSAGERLTGGYINDYRVYDHCLSVEEIKEISQALILHYPLNQSNRSKNLISSFTAGGRTAVTDRTVIIQPQTTTADTYFDIKLNEALVANTEYTLSCQIKDMDCNADWYFPLFAQSNPISKNLIIYKDKTFTSVTFSLPTGNTYVGATNIFMDDTSRPSSNPGYITLYNFKLEKGSFATPWCFPGEDNTIEYDCSGYNRNGTVTASTCPVIANDSPRNSYCYSFDGTNDYIQIPQTTIDTSGVTFSIWAKWKAWNSWSRAWDFGTASGAKRTIVLANSNSTSSITVAGRCNDSQGSLPDTAIFTGTLNTWYHIVVTIQGTTCKAYKNGELVKTFTLNANMGTFTAPTCYLAKSNWPDGYFNGELSDFRLYATALSADDIARLYRTSASVDKSKRLHCYELVEE